MHLRQILHILLLSSTAFLFILCTHVVTRAVIDKAHKSHPNELRSAYTLLIIQGAYRTFDIVVDSVITNLIETNSPCEVLVSLDRPPPNNSLALIKLAPYLFNPGVIYPNFSETHLGTKIEFSQVIRALEVARPHLLRFRYVMKTRTDVMIKQPCRFSMAVAAAPVFHSHFRKFVAFFQQYPFITPTDVLSMWFMTGGNLFYARAMFNPTHLMPWSPVGPHMLVQDLLNGVRNVSNALWHGNTKQGWKILSNTQLMMQVVAALAVKHNVMFMTGSTWVLFGGRDDFCLVFEDMHNHYHNLTWATYYQRFWFGDAWPVSHPVTESIFRISHLRNNKSLVDLFNKQDYIFSFGSPSCYGSTQLQNGSADGIAVVIVRQQHVGCQTNFAPLPPAFMKHEWSLCDRPSPNMSKPFSRSHMHDLGTDC